MHVLSPFLVLLLCGIQHEMTIIRKIIVHVTKQQVRRGQRVIKKVEPSVVMNACNPRIWEAEADLRVQDRLVLHSKFQASQDYIVG